MKRAALFVCLLTLLAGAGALLQSARLTPGSFKVENDNNDLVISWQTDVEDGVVGFELHRKTPFSNGFQPVRPGQNLIPAHGTGKPYLYRDTQVYKATSEQVEYQLEAVLASGARQSLQSKTVNYTPTAVRRTWGSIKAMFQ